MSQLTHNTANISVDRSTVEISIAILAWNEQDAIGSTLDSLFQQSFFQRLAEQGRRCEVLCVVNGCTDQTPQIAQGIFDEMLASHPHRQAFSCRVANLLQRGKANAWNVFVHDLSARSAEFLIVMDADIWITKPDTLWNMVEALRREAEANVAVDQPIKDVAVRAGRSLMDRVSLATSRINQADGAQMTGQLYCIRSRVARQIFLPRDLIIEDGFIKTMVCTDMLSKPSNPARIVRAEDAAHVFEAYRSVGAILKNQKRQMIGQTTLHVLLDKELPSRDGRPRSLAEEIRQRERLDPDWLKRITAVHLAETKRFWRLFPGIPGFRLKRLARLQGLRRCLYLPAACAGVIVTLISCWMAHRFLRRGHTHYWPETKSPGLKELQKHGSRSDRAALASKPHPQEELV